MERIKRSRLHTQETRESMMKVLCACTGAPVHTYKRGTYIQEGYNYTYKRGGGCVCNTLLG